jgi:putative ATPase
MELAIETSVWSFPEGETPPQINFIDLRWPPPENAAIQVSMEAAEESIQRRAVLYDRDGDYHFDTISAFIKSVRGSDPDAALYWLAKMVRAGEDPSFIFRRMIILASEDVGLADPQALSVVISCAESFDRIGFPEGNFPLAHACLYLATAPKSNTALSFFDALKEVDREDAEVPNHLRDASRDAESFGHGEGYVYPHAYRDHWAAQQYLPTALRGRTFYIPSLIGYEGKIREEVLRKRELQAAIVLGEDIAASGELLTWSQAAKGREGWFRRLESGRAKLLLSDRDALFKAASPSRHARVLIPQANDGLLLWESLRRCPEGLCAALVDSPEARDALLRYAAVLDQVEQPEIAVLEGETLPSPAQADQWFSSAQFERIVLREPWKRGMGKASLKKPAGKKSEKTSHEESINPAKTFQRLAAQAMPLLADGGSLCLLCSPPPLGERISRILREECAADDALAAAVSRGEDQFFSRQPSKAGADSGNFWAWDADTLQTAFEKEGFSVQVELLEQNEERLISERDLSAWFDLNASRWGAFFSQAMPKEEFTQVQELLRARASQGPIMWKWKSVLLVAGK